jgi:hypothetical protein
MTATATAVTATATAVTAATATAATATPTKAGEVSERAEHGRESGTVIVGGAAHRSKRLLCGVAVVAASAAPMPRSLGQGG